VLALHIGALAVVQPVLVSGLIFALLLRTWRHDGHVSRREGAWAGILTLSLIGFLLLADTADQPSAGAADREPAAAAAVIGVVLAVTCVLLARQRRGADWSAALIGVAVGIIYAATAALIKSLTTVFALHGAAEVATSWQLYVLVAVGAVGLLLNQLAFQAGPLTASLPAICTVDPLASIAIGVLVYGEHIRRGAPAGAGLGVLMLLLGIAIIALTRSAANHQDLTSDSR